MDRRFASKWQKGPIIDMNAIEGVVATITVAAATVERIAAGVVRARLLVPGVVVVLAPVQTVVNRRRAVAAVAVVTVVRKMARLAKEARLEAVLEAKVVESVFPTHNIGQAFSFVQFST